MSYLLLSQKKCSRGLTIVEVVIGIALFSLVSMGIYQTYSRVMTLVAASREKVVAMDLVNEQFEIVRNLPYSDVGIEGSIPDGLFPHVQTLVRSGYTFIATTTIRNIDDPFDGTLGGTPNDTSPADNKLVEIELDCPSCRNFPRTFVNTRVAPKNLETASTNGALFIQVLDANGQPVENADVHIENTQQSPNVIIDDMTNNSGMLQIVDAPPGVNAYAITVSKSGYTTSRTYATSTGNPNPTKPHATVAVQQVTQISFVIDQESIMNVSSMTPTCIPVSGLVFSVAGTKLIGTTPDILLYDVSHTTNGSGSKTISGLEWDSYTLTSTDVTYDIIGTNAVFPINLVPGSTQDVQLVVAPKDPQSLLVIVKDIVTQLPLASTTVQLEYGAFDETLITGRGFLGQTSWSGGGGQDSFVSQNQYFSSSNIDYNNPAGDIKLTGSFGTYDPSGNLISSTFDTGTTTNFQQIQWSPLDQPPDAGADSVRLQFATNNDGTTWDYLGPDGTSGSYFTTANSNISATHNGTRYARYKVLLDTASTTYTPNISDVSFTFSSSCVPSGQVLFSGLSNGTYNLNIEREGYVDYTQSVDITTAWKQVEVFLNPE